MPDVTHFLRARRKASLAVLASTVVLLTGCTGNAANQQPTTRTTTSVATQPTAAASATPLSALDVQVNEISVALRQLANEQSKPSTDQVRSVLARYSSDPGSIEVSASKTPTGLDADAIQAAVKIDNTCIVSGIRSGQSTTVKLPVLASGRCFEGTSRRG